MYLVSQNKDGLVASYSFNRGNSKDDLGKYDAKEIGVSYVVDRFGNENSACYLFGAPSSYLNLGTDDDLKPHKGTISLWINIDIAVESGTGYKMNPIILTKRQPTDDSVNNFFEGYAIYYDYGRKRICGAATQSSLTQIGVVSNFHPQLYNWYHIALTYDNDSISLYINGNKQNTLRKGFQTKFMKGDSVMIGNSANEKNKRFFNGSIDDIMIYNRVLSHDEIRNLYNSPNPNRFAEVTKWFFIIAAFTLAIAGIVVLFVRRYKKRFEKELERNRLQNKIYELEIKAMKAQMNPHFIFNSLNSIQQFILEKDDQNAYNYLSKFSLLVRKILETNNKESIALNDEVEILKGYLEIEDLRFSNAFDWKIIKDPKLSANKITIPHMMIQPFVENAIWHGLLHKKGDKKLTIEFSYIDEDKLTCIIEDNGAGRNAIKKEAVTTKQSLAIDLIKQRLELLSKMKRAKYTLFIKDKKEPNGDNAGTLVELTLPILN
jgi:anti-sigma regulatory factor (Ser/Thr protein kinase)